MLLSELFVKTRKEFPKDEVSRNAGLLLKSAYIDKLSAGVYTYLPLGLRVLKNIEHIIRKEMNAIGGQEILMPSLQPKENWEKTGRLAVRDDLFKVIDAQGKEAVLGPTHEEVVTPLVQQFVQSYKDLPKAVYQFQNKFRMELRAKSGILRGREFIMKDLYSFHIDEKDFEAYYDKAKEAYRNIFDKVGIGHVTYLTLASGGNFSKLSHEFQTLTPAGEDTIYLCEKCSIAVNREIFEEVDGCPECKAPKDSLKEAKAIEVGNIFPLKTRFSDAFNFTVKDEHGEERPVIMGCYGIGLGRLMGTVVEVLSDDKGIVWPHSIAPFHFHLVALGKEESYQAAGVLYRELMQKGFDVLYDDRPLSAGAKLSDAELMGMPYIIVVSDRTREAGDILELRDRSTGKSHTLPRQEFLEASYGTYFDKPGK